MLHHAGSPVLAHFQTASPGWASRNPTVCSLILMVATSASLAPPQTPWFRSRFPNVNTNKRNGFNHAFQVVRFVEFVHPQYVLKASASKQRMYLIRCKQNIRQQRTNMYRRPISFQCVIQKAKVFVKLAHVNGCETWLSTCTLKL